MESGPCDYMKAREERRDRKRGNWSGSYYNTPGMRQQNQTCRMEWNGVGKKNCQNSGSEIS